MVAYKVLPSYVLYRFVSAETHHVAVRKPETSRHLFRAFLGIDGTFDWLIVFILFICVRDGIDKSFRLSHRRAESAGWPRS